MPSYADPLVITYSRDTATTDATWAIKTPDGCSHCKVVDINASVTTTYNAVTTAAKVGVGVAGNVNDLGYISLGETAAGSAAGLGSQIVRGTNPKYQAFSVDGTSNTITATDKVPDVLGPILITFTANTGGSPAGAAVADVTLAWW
jgi:hypothetical protein